MATTNFVSGTLIESAWLNDVDSAVYTTLPSVVSESAVDAANLASHIADPTAAHSASSISNTPAGSLLATDVQTAINELDSEKQPLDTTLTALSGILTAANKIPYATALNTAGELDFKDEDDMVSNSATAVPSQQSVKAYVDTVSAATSGTYVPTIVLVANTDAAGVVGTFKWTRIGNIVRVSGRYNVVATAIGVSTIAIPLPVASSFVSDYDLHGMGLWREDTVVFCEADPAGDRALVRYNAPTALQSYAVISFEYAVI